MVDNLSISAHPLPMCMLKSLLVDKILIPRYKKWFTNIRDLPFDEDNLR